MEKEQEEKITELAEKIRKQKITPMQKYEDTVNEYLGKRLADYDMPDYVKMEIAQFMAQQTIILLHEYLTLEHIELNKQMKKACIRRDNLRHNET